MFPQINATNLLRQKLYLPQDFQGEINFLLIAFYQWHQSQVDTWIPFLRELENIFPQVHYYELPTIKRMNLLAQTFINEGMRAGIPDPLARERTVTLYTNKDEFHKILEIVDERDIQVIAIDRTGYVHWREKGVFSPEKAEEVISFLKKQFLSVPKNSK